MSYDDDNRATPTLCDYCHKRTKEGLTKADKLLLFRCEGCKYEFCHHMEGRPASGLCPDCTKADEYGPLGVDDWN
jgi:hypothetical protein